jgi:hypothetical protein
VARDISPWGLVDLARVELNAKVALGNVEGRVGHVVAFDITAIRINFLWSRLLR